MCLRCARHVCRLGHLISYQLSQRLVWSQREHSFWLDGLIMTPAGTDRWSGCLLWMNSILRFCSSSDLPKIRQHFFTCEKERMPQSWVALWWSVLCWYGLLDGFGLTWRDHVPCVPLCNLISASKMCVAYYTEVLLAPFSIFIWGLGTRLPWRSGPCGSNSLDFRYSVHPYSWRTVKVPSYDCTCGYQNAWALPCFKI